jgi:Arc/MetJ family transcription regulator
MLIMMLGVSMRTTVTIDNDLYEEALRVSKLSKPSELVSESLQALIKQEKAKRLVVLGGSLPEFVTPVRNR